MNKYRAQIMILRTQRRSNKNTFTSTEKTKIKLHPFVHFVVVQIGSRSSRGNYNKPQNITTHHTQGLMITQILIHHQLNTESISFSAEHLTHQEKLPNLRQLRYEYFLPPMQFPSEEWQKKPPQSQY